jgi:hypothetical protein
MTLPSAVCYRLEIPGHHALVAAGADVVAGAEACTRSRCSRNNLADCVRLRMRSVHGRFSFTFVVTVSAYPLEEQAGEVVLVVGRGKNQGIFIIAVGYIA